MLNEKNMHVYFLVEVVASAMYIMNWIPNAVIHGMMSNGKYIGIKPNISHLKVFVCIAYVHIPTKRRTKLDPKAKK